MKFRARDRLLYIDWTDNARSRIRKVTGNDAIGLYFLRRPGDELALSKDYVETHYILLTRLTSMVTGICK